MRDFLAIGLIFIAYMGCSSPAKMEAKHVVKEYKPGLVVDLCIPSSSGVRSLVVFIDGGYWRSGNPKTFLPGLRKKLCDEGFVTASIGYGLGPKNSCMDQVLDIADALNWLKKNKATYGIDDTQIGILGTSAGAHLGLMYALGAGRNTTRALIAYGAPTDLRDQMIFSKPEYVRDCIQNSKAEEVSPVFLVTRGTPKMLIVHGDADATIPIDQSRQLYKALKKFNAQVEFEVYPGGNHNFLFEKNPRAEKVKGDMIQFFKENLSPPSF